MKAPDHLVVPGELRFVLVQLDAPRETRLVLSSERCPRSRDLFYAADLRARGPRTPEVCLGVVMAPRQLTAVNPARSRDA